MHLPDLTDTGALLPHFLQVGRVALDFISFKCSEIPLYNFQFRLSLHHTSG